MNMKLENLLVSYRNYNAKKVGKTGMLIQATYKGLYRANKPEDIVSILTEGWSDLPVYVRTSKKAKWKQIEPSKG